MFKNMIMVVAVVVFFNWSFCNTEEDQELIIKAIEIGNNENTKTEVIIKQIKSKVGEKFSSKTIQEDIKAIFKLGLFSDVKVYPKKEADGIRLIYIVEEKPLIGEITIKGNKEIKEGKIKEIIKDLKGTTFEEKKISKVKEEIINLYQKEGYYLVEVKSKTENIKDENKKIVIFEITEGEKIKIKEINIIGNRVFSDKKIKKQMETEETGLLASGIFKKEVFEADLERIIDFYNNNGYINAEIKSYDISYDQNKTKIFIIIEIKEGNCFKIGKRNFRGNTVFSKSELLSYLKLKEGEIFNKRKFEQDIQQLQSAYSERGYIYAEIVPQKILDKVKLTVDVIYDITERGIYNITDIIIQGNEETKDYVIRRELLLKPGDRFDVKKLRRSLTKLFQTGYFQSIVPTTEPSLEENKLDLIIEVKERQTGQVQLGMGYNNIDKLLGLFEISKDNFMGRGQKIYIKYEVGKEKKTTELGFTEPWLFNHPLYSDMRFYNEQKDENFFEEVYKNYSYNEEEVRIEISQTDPIKYKRVQNGFDFTLGYRFFDFHSLYFTCRSAQTKYELIKLPISIHDDKYLRDYGGPGKKGEEPTNEYFNYDFYHPGSYIDKLFDSYPLEKKKEGKVIELLNSLSFSYIWDNRDNPFNTIKGFKIKFYSEYAGLGGNVNFIKYTADYGHYFPLWWGTILGFHSNYGIAKGYNGDDVPYEERFVVGGANTVRGYREYSLGQACLVRLFFNLELKKPLVEDLESLEAMSAPMQYSFTPAIFIDAGYGWSEFEASKILQQDWEELFKLTNLKDLKLGAGIGIRVDMPPLGQLRFDYGWKLSKFKKGESPGEFHFSLGQIF